MRKFGNMHARLDSLEKENATKEERRLVLMGSSEEDLDAQYAAALASGEWDASAPVERILLVAGQPVQRKASQEVLNT